MLNLTKQVQKHSKSCCNPPNDQMTHIHANAARPPTLWRPLFTGLCMFNNSSGRGPAALLPSLLCVIVCRDAPALVPWPVSECL